MWLVSCWRPGVSSTLYSVWNLLQNRFRSQVHREVFNVGLSYLFGRYSYFERRLPEVILWAHAACFLLQAAAGKSWIQMSSLLSKNITQFVGRLKRYVSKQSQKIPGVVLYSAMVFKSFLKINSKT